MTFKMTTSQAAQKGRPVLLADAPGGEPQLEFTVLIGSRAADTARSDSETLRRKLAKTMATTIDKIGLIELRRANLTMRANVAKNGVLLMGEGSHA